MRLYLVDGTYELFRAYFAMPSAQAPNGQPTGAVRGLVQTLLALLRRDQPTHIACAFDHVIESFRNRLFAGYKTGEGTPEELLAQFALAERATESLGIATWPMTEFEADDALAAASSRWADEPAMEQVVICSPDKDLAQVVKGSHVVCLDRRRNQTMDEDGVIAKFGVQPASIPDYLALLEIPPTVYPASHAGEPRAPRSSCPTTPTWKPYLTTHRCGKWSCAGRQRWPPA